MVWGSGSESRSGSNSSISVLRSVLLTGWLSALGKGSSNVSIYREESMITLARSRKGLGTEKWEMKGKDVLAR